MTINLITETINQLRDGLTAEETSEQLNKCIQRSKETKKVSELTIKLKIRSDILGNKVYISDEITLKLPPYPRELTTFYQDDDGDLSIEPPITPQIPATATTS